MYYVADSAQVVFENNESKVGFKLNLNCEQSGYLANSLNIELQFYQDGIMRALVDQENSDRFRISAEDLPVQWDQLIPLSSTEFNAAFKWTEDGFRLKGLKRSTGEDDETTYEVGVNPFKIT